MNCTASVTDFMSIATIFVATFFSIVIPAFSTRPALLAKKYNASEREKTIIYEVYEKQSVVTKTTSWGMIIVYGLFAGAMVCGRRNDKDKGS